MGTITKFEDLIIWQDSRCLVNNVYKEFRDVKDYGFKDQIQRASVSIMNNIAEGFERYSDVEFRRFLIIAKASCGEVRSMLYLAEDLNYLNQKQAELLRQNSRVISGSIQNLIKKLRQNGNS